MNRGGIGRGDDGLDAMKDEYVRTKEKKLVEILANHFEENFKMA